MRRLIPLFITLLLLSCANDSDTYKLIGNAHGFEDGAKLYVYNVEDNNQPEVVDTLVVQQQKFEASYPKTDKLLLGYLGVENPRGTVVFFPENEDLTVHIYKDSLAASYVTGSKLNEAYSDFLRTVNAYAQRKQELGMRFQVARQQQDLELARQIQLENAQLVEEEAAYKMNFARENNNSIYSIMLVNEMLNRKEITAAEARELIDNLPPKFAASLLASDLKATLAQMKKADIGELAPDFSAPTPEGEMLSLKETLGKYTIVDFWASWCKPCRIENPNVVRVYEKYHDKGLNIISVSLDRDGQKERWLQAIEDDNMDWYHVSNLKFWQDPIAKAYNVRSIPATFLLDENGRIIDKDLRGPALEAKIASLLGE